MIVAALGTYPRHFFEVEMREVNRIKNDVLLNEEAVQHYLSQVGPLPFDPSFSAGPRILEFMQEHGLGRIYRLFLNSAKDPIYRPHRDKFEARKGVLDAFTEPQFFTVPSMGDGLAAVGWVLHHSYHGALSCFWGIKGLRLRKGDIQIGTESLLDEVFPEPRFNDWCVGEFHCVEPAPCAERT